MSTIDQITTAEQLLEASLPHCELLKGELNMMSPAGFDHGRFAINIGNALANHAKKSAAGIVVSAEAGFHISHDPDTVRVPDVAFVRANRVPQSGVKGFFPGAPDIAVEVISPNDRASEVLAKSQDWLQAGCRMVWVVDPETRTVTVYRSRNEIDILNETDTLTGGELLPEFSILVSDIFA